MGVKNVCHGSTDPFDRVSQHRSDLWFDKWEPVDEMQMGVMIMEGRLSDAIDKLAHHAEEASYPTSDNTSAVAIQIMSLQLMGRAINDGISEQVDKASKLDPVDNAIDVIEQTFKLYKDEM